MSRRLTRLDLAALGLVAWAVWLGVVSGRGELFLVPVPLLVGLAWARLAGGAPRWSLTHEVSTVRLIEGEQLRVTVTLTAATALPQVEVLEPLPRGVEVVAGHPHVVRAVRAGETVRWQYDLRFPARGHVTLGTLLVRVWPRAGSGVIEVVGGAPRPVHVYPRPAAVRWLPDPLRTQPSVGDYVSGLIGDGLEPGEIRRFAPGDRIRHVNWRASLRLGRLYVTRHHAERNADVVLMLDSLGQVGAGGATTLDDGIRVAASLAAAYLSRKDRVGLVDYGAVFRWVRPGSGHAQLERLLDTLLRSEVAFTYVARDLSRVPPRILPPQALVIAVSPLLDERFVGAMRDLAGRGFDLVVLAVDPVPAARRALPARGPVEAAGRLWRIERRIALDDLRRQGLRVVEWNPEEPVDLALARLGRGRARAAVG